MRALDQEIKHKILAFEKREEEQKALSKKLDVEEQNKIAGEEEIKAIKAEQEKNLDYLELHKNDEKLNVVLSKLEIMLQQ